MTSRAKSAAVPVDDSPATRESAALLDVDGLSAGYGKRSVVEDVSLFVGQGEIVAFLGHNGAGKTTTLRAVSGLLRPRHGRVLLGDLDLTQRPAAATASAGIAFVPQGNGVFPSLTIDENLALGAAVASRRSDAGYDASAMVHSLFPILADRRKQRAGSLSGGQRQMVALSMALMAQPRLLCLDEPSTGLAPVLVDEVLDAVRRVNEETGTSVLLVEQDIKRVLAVADRVYVIKLGSIVFEGTPEALEKRDWSALF